MVAAVETSPRPAACERVSRILNTVGLPGDAADHAWIADKIFSMADQLGGRSRHEYFSDLLLTGLLLERGLNPAASPELQGRGFPEHYVRTVPPLLKIGCPVRCWQLVEKGVLGYEGAVWGGETRWVIRGEALKPLFAEWHELGERLVLRHLARGLLPLLNDAGRVPQIRISGVDRKTGRKWARELCGFLRAEGAGQLPHLVLGA